MYRPLKRIARQRRAMEKRIAAEMKAMEQQIKTRTSMSPEEIAAEQQKRQARVHGRPSHYGKPVTYWRRRNTPKSDRIAA